MEMEMSLEDNEIKRFKDHVVQGSGLSEKSNNAYTIKESLNRHQFGHGNWIINNMKFIDLII